MNHKKAVKIGSRQQLGGTWRQLIPSLFELGLLIIQQFFKQIIIGFFQRRGQLIHRQYLGADIDGGASRLLPVLSINLSHGFFRLKAIGGEYSTGNQGQSI